MTRDDYAEIDAAFEAVLTTAMEAEHIITREVRNSLSDDCFGIIDKDADGNIKRSYPLRVPHNKAKTQELTEMAVRMFHYCRPEWKPKLAKKIAEVAKKENLKFNVNSKNQIFKYIKESEFPATVRVIAPQDGGSKR